MQQQEKTQKENVQGIFASDLSLGVTEDEILLTRRKTLSNQSINQSINLFRVGGHRQNEDY